MNHQETQFSSKIRSIIGMHVIYEGDVNVLTKKVWPTTRNNMSHFCGKKIRAGINCAKMKHLWFATEKHANTIIHVCCV